MLVEVTLGITKTPMLRAFLERSRECLVLETLEILDDRISKTCIQKCACKNFRTRIDARGKKNSLKKNMLIMNEKGIVHGTEIG